MLKLVFNPMTSKFDFVDIASGTVPTGGTAGQVLSKIDSTNYNTQWIDFDTLVMVDVYLTGSTYYNSTFFDLVGENKESLVIQG